MVEAIKRVTKSEEYQNVMKKRSESEEWKKNQKIGGKKRSESKEWQKNIKIAAKKRSENKEWQKNHKIAAEKRSEDPNFGKRVSAGRQGIPYDEWEDYASEQKYCPKFDEECRESNREKYDRKCFLTGLPEEENVTKNGDQRHLSVHHYDMDKGQGCNGKKWKLVPLSMEWHRKVHNELWEARIIWLLDNVWN